ncbi:EscU/YscU/HrcU family type III secretion system export apparatus switch protein [Clostridium sp. D2Q-11]|uniref:EscU/YscU/HrcU family type III secretion system export apparatus switch protein n=1 Tax=Anaeromonas frigoriresistens TaxID=2683708 RepID=A0A942UW16_9FIRM|nr:EscU/YscU/HrcU family type III secretion system export apparatus switch protein [Anaeromonas frigoriresistens]MBS4540108.1 EscU/YscU/HrcU family type III secretion system export apparatus switch protein [Anaeromonas frigoriresistens]
MNNKRFNFKNNFKEKRAIAVHYDNATDSLPEIVSRRKGKMAEELIEIAKIRDIPLEEDISLLGNLLDMDLGENIPPQLYSVIAEVFLLLQDLEGEA